MSRSSNKKTFSLSRRQFLVRSAGLAGASLGWVGAQAGAGEPGGKTVRGKRIRWGIVGTGERGSQLLSLALQLPNVQVAALCEIHPQNLQRARELAKAHKPLITADLEKVLELGRKGDMDALLIATPPHLHASQALAALEAGVHLYLEKPLALSAGDCGRVFQAARQAEARGQVFQIGLERRYNPRYLAAIEAIRRGDAGRILFVRAQWHTLGEPPRQKGWYYQREKSGDLVVEQACHQMDVFNWVFGAVPLAACGLGGIHRREEESPGRSIRDHYGLILEYPGGGKVELSHLTYAVPDRRFSGIYELVFGENLGIDLANALAWDRHGKVIELTRQGGSDTRLALEAFFRHVRGQEKPAASPQVGYQATLASLLGLQALDTGRLARWEEVADPRA